MKHFRSHPSIIAFSNQHFYGNELEPCGDPVMTHSLEQSESLVKRGFPITFHGIVGKDEQEASSPSYFNINEASLVKRYCLSLVTDRRPRVRK